MLAVLVLIYGIIQNRSVFGRHVYAIGGNRHAAELSGIKTRQVDFWLFVNMGTLAALAGLIFTARLNLAGPKAVTASSSRRSRPPSSVARPFRVASHHRRRHHRWPHHRVLNNGMSIMGIGIEWQQAVKGFVLLLAVAFDVFNKRRSAVADRRADA